MSLFPCCSGLEDLWWRMEEWPNSQLLSLWWDEDFFLYITQARLISQHSPKVFSPECSHLQRREGTGILGHAVEERSLEWWVTVQLPNTHLKSFLRKFNETFSSDGRAFRSMLDELCNLIRQGKLTAPACTEVGLQDYSKALDMAMQPFTSAKQVLIMWTQVSKLEHHHRGACSLCSNWLQKTLNCSSEIMSNTNAAFNHLLPSSCLGHFPGTAEG